MSSTRDKLIFAFGAVSLALAVASPVFAKVAIPAMMMSIIAILVQRSKRMRLLLLVALPLVLVGLVRFTMVEAMPGIVEAGREALTTRAVAALRELRFTEDVLREQAYWDPDGDKIGSAGLVVEVSGQVKLRGQKDAPPGLVQRFVKFETGETGPFAAHAGYGFIIYLPTPDGDGTAAPGDAVDDEAAERRYVAYAWPLTIGHGEHPVLYLDEHERIWVSDNSAQRYSGKDRVPAFNAALPTAKISPPPTGDEIKGQDGATWRPWKGKAPRRDLPGDNAARKASR